MGVYLILDELCSSRIKDTLGHMSTPAFSVDSELLRADAFQIVVVYGVYGVLSLSSRLFLYRYRLYSSVQLVLAVCCRPFAERARVISVYMGLCVENVRSL